MRFSLIESLEICKPNFSNLISPTLSHIFAFSRRVLCQCQGLFRESGRRAAAGKSSADRSPRFCSSFRIGTARCSIFSKASVSLVRLKEKTSPLNTRTLKEGRILCPNVSTSSCVSRLISLWYQQGENRTSCNRERPSASRLHAFR